MTAAQSNTADSISTPATRARPLFTAHARINTRARNTREKRRAKHFYDSINATMLDRQRDRDRQPH